jgi:hypothetical protein
VFPRYLAISGSFSPRCPAREGLPTRSGSAEDMDRRIRAPLRNNDKYRGRESVQLIDHELLHVDPLPYRIADDACSKRPRRRPTRSGAGFAANLWRSLSWLRPRTCSTLPLQNAHTKYAHCTAKSAQESPCRVGTNDGVSLTVFASIHARHDVYALAVRHVLDGRFVVGRVAVADFRRYAELLRPRTERAEDGSRPPCMLNETLPTRTVHSTPPR